MAEKYFGRIPKGPDLEPIRTGEPAQYSEKRFYGEGPAPTSLQMMFHIPPDGDPDTAALSVLAGTLGSGGGGFRGGMGGGGGHGAPLQEPRPRQAAGRQRLGLEPAAVVRRRLPVQRDAARRQGRQARGPGEGDLGRDREDQEGRPDRGGDPEGQEQGRGHVRPQPRQHRRAGQPGRPGRAHAGLAVHPDRPRRPPEGHQRRHQARRRQVLRQGQQPDGHLHPEVGPVRRTT
ncbi:MAG: insulinase family protein [Anaerotruncus sp.]|nr:insulinase family protein [Anaerotruncus sp.]